MRRRDVLVLMLGLTEARAADRLVALSGDRYAEHGQERRLTDILAPDEEGLFGPEPYSAQSRRALQSLLAQPIAAVIEEDKTDRWGRRLVRPILLSRPPLRALSVQERIVREGAARVLPETPDDDFILALLALENAARIARLGLWDFAAYRVLSPQDASSALGRFGIVEGVVLEVSQRPGRTYLNFGADYRTDFTVSCASRLVRAWRANGFDLSVLAGQRIRARGYVASINGPAIEISHRRAIEVLGEGAVSAPE